MARIVKDRVKDTSTTTGTGTITLANSPPNGFQAFSVLGDGSTTFYCIEDANGTAFEIGVGTYTGNTLARTTILESSNSDNAISLTSGTHTAFVTYPSNRSTFNDEGLSPTFTASGTITAGKPVIQNTNGTVTQVGTTTIASGTGTLSTNTVSNAEEGQVAMGATNQFVNLYRVANTSNQYLTANTISSTDLKTITRGATVNFDSGKERNAGIIYEPNQEKYVVIALNSNNYLTATTATFSGTGSSATLTLGTQTVIDSNAWTGSGFQNANITYDTTAQKIVVAGTKSGTNNAVCIVINLDGTTFTQGSRTTVTIATPSEYASDNVICAYSSTENRVVFLYAENSQSDSTADIYTTVGTVSGTSISFGSAQAVGNRVDTGYSNMSKDTTLSVDNNGVIVITHLSQSYTLYSQSATLSNTTLTWGSTSQISNITCLSGAFGECGSVKIASGKTIMVRATKSDSPSNANKGIFCVITVSGTSVSNGSVQEFSSSATRYPNVSSNYSKTQALINFGSGSENNIIFQESSQEGPSNLNSTNFFGIASNSATTTNPVQINVNGSINNAQTSLTVDKDYYVTDAGLIKERTTTTVTPNTNPTASTITEQNGSTYSYWANSIAYETTSGYYVRGRREATNNYPVVESGTWGSLSTGITWNTPTVLYSHIMRNNEVRVATGGGYAHLAYCTRENSNENAKVTPVAISGSGSLSVGTTTTVSTTATSSSEARPYGIEYDTSQNTILAFFYLGWTSGYLNKVFPLQMSGANYSYSSSDAVTLTSGIDVYMKSLNTVFDPDTNRTIAFYNKDNATTAVNGIVLSCSGTTITKGATQTPSLTAPTSNCWTAVAYDTQNNKIIFMYYVSSPVNYAPKYSIVTVTGGGTNTLSFTSDAYVFANTSQQAQACALTWNGDANKLFMVYPKYGNAHIQCNTFTSNGSTLTTTSEGEISTNEIQDSASQEDDASVFVTGKGVSYSLGNADTSPGIVNFTLSLGSTTSTVVNGSVFAGTALSATALELKTFPASTIVGKADGAVTKGKPVIVEADGDFAQVEGSSTSVVSPETQQVSTSPATEDKFFIANNGSGTIGVISDSSSSGVQFVLGTDDGTSITWGTPVTVNSNTYFSGVSVYYDPDEDKFICTYIATSALNEVRSRIISYSGTTATLSTESSAMTKDNATVNVVSSAYDTTNNKGYICLGKELGRMFTVTVSGTTITQSALSSQFSGSGNSMQFGHMVYDNTNNVGYITYRNEAISDYPYIQTYTVSGNTFTFGTETVIESLAADGYVGVAEGSADGNGVCVAWKRSGTGIKYITPTFSGLAPTVGTSATLSGGQVPDDSLYWEGAQVVNYNPVSKTFILAYQDTTGKFDIITNSGSVSGGTLTFSDYDVVYPTTNSSQYYAISSPTGKNANNAFIIQQRYNQSPNKIAGSIWGAAFSTSNLTAENYIGIAQETVSTNEDVKVTTVSGVDANQSSLTPAQLYYVQIDGTLSTTAGSPSVVAGIATSATTLLVNRS